MKKNNKTLRYISVLAMIITGMVCLGAYHSFSYAAMNTVPVPQTTSETRTGEYYAGEYYKVTTPANEDDTIYVEGRTKIPTKRFCIRLKKHNPASGDTTYPVTIFVVPDSNGEFSIKFKTTKGNKSKPQVIDGKGTVAGSSSYGTRPGRYGVSTMSAGTYHLTIARATTDAQANISKSNWYSGVLGGSSGYAYKEALLMVKKGDENNPKLIQYNDVIQNNKLVHDSVTRSVSSYKDTYLKDIKFVLKNPSTGAADALTSSQVKYLAKVADEVTASATTDYQKLEKIYEYVGGNVYYDYYAYQKGKNQYANPYRNLYNMRNGVDTANSKDGKVATTCQGYSAMVIALARAEGIPTRLVYGHHISQPTKIWANISASQIKTRSHWWTEAYVDGRWIIIDANAATYNRWTRSSFSDKGTYRYSGVADYSYFDADPEQFANSYSYNGIYYYGNSPEVKPGTTPGVTPTPTPSTPSKPSADVELKSNHEIKQLRSFLNTKSSGITNGGRLNSKYSAYEFNTWNNGVSNNFVVNKSGRVERIAWYREKLYGDLDLSDFTSLKKVLLYTNKLKSIDLSNCPNLTYISASYNDFTSFDSTSSSKMTYINLQGNELRKAKFRYGKTQRVVSISTNTSKGYFGMKYNTSNSKKITIYAKTISGYKYQGIYNGSTGKRISKKTTYSFNPSHSTYYVKYKKK